MEPFHGVGVDQDDGEFGFRVHIEAFEHIAAEAGQAGPDQLVGGPPEHRTAVVLCDEYVGRLEVAVDDPLLVGVLHRVADLHE